MPRHPRNAPGGFVYHVLNRAVARHALVPKEGDYQAFERALAQTLEKHCKRVLVYTVMPNHWHFVLWPEGDGDLTAFIQFESFFAANAGRTGCVSRRIL